MEPVQPKISVEYGQNAVIITFTEEKILEERDIQALQESIMSVAEQQANSNIILDFKSVRFLSSAVLGLLIRLSKKIYQQGGELRLCSIDPKIYEVFKITRLTQVFDICDDLESAKQSLPEKSEQ